MTVFRWDIDKSYLQTDFETVSGLVKVATEDAKDKKTIAGATPLVRALRRHPDSFLMFISGSPKQMRRILLQKFELDGISVDQLILKDSFSSLKRGRIREIKNQFAFKLSSLLKDRLNYSPLENEYLFGDSAEVDAYVYATYALILSEQISESEVVSLLRKAGAYQRSIEQVRKSLNRLEPGGIVERIFIRLVDGFPHPVFQYLFPVVIPVFHWSQAGIVLYQDGVLSLETLQDIWNDEGFRKEAQANLIQDMQRRGFIQEDVAVQMYGRLGINRPILPIKIYTSTLSSASLNLAMESIC